MPLPNNETIEREAREVKLTTYVSYLCESYERLLEPSKSIAYAGSCKSEAKKLARLKISGSDATYKSIWLEEWRDSKAVSVTMISSSK